MGAMQAFVIIFFPLLALLGAKKSKILDTISPVVLCYAFGILMGNLAIFKSSWSLNKSISTELSEISIILALPLLLFVTDFIGWLKLAPKTILSYSLQCLGVFIACLLVGYFYRDRSDDVWQAVSMLSGVYVGGTSNLTAIGMALSADQNLFILLNAADIVLSSIYLLGLFTFVPRLLSRFLPEFEHQQDEAIEASKHSDPLTLFEHYKRIPFYIGELVLSGLVVGLSFALAKFFGETMRVAWIIMFVTTFSILLSFWNKIRGLPGSYELGNYFLLIFCTAIGSLANLTELYHVGPFYFQLTALVIILALVFHFIFAYLFKIDYHTMIITSVAGIMGPPFVPPIANVLKNRAIVVSGITTGIIGYAIGNYIGLLIAWILK